MTTARIKATMALLKAIWPICHQPYALRSMLRSVVPWKMV